MNARLKKTAPADIPASTSPKLYVYARCSTVKQEDGDSLDRQMRYAHAYAKSHGMEIDEKLVLRDPGVSAYTGKNRTHGELGKFLELVKGGKIAKGSGFMVENIDRLTREDMIEGLGLVSSIVKEGINLIVSGKNLTITDEGLRKDPGMLIGLVLEFFRGNGESGRKSNLITDALFAKCERWMNGTYKFKSDKKGEGGQIGGGSHPFWIEWDDKTFEYRLLEDKVAAVHAAIALYRAGHGAVMIARKLQDAGLVMTGAESGMTRTIRHTFTLPALMGVRAIEVGKRRGKEKDASKIQTYELHGYYPPILTPTEFASLQQVRKQRRTDGLKGDVVAVLTGARVTYCGHCGRIMVAQNQMSRTTRESERTGRPTPGQRRILCASYVNAMPCPHRGTIQTHMLEEAIMQCCSDDFNLAHLMKIDARHDGLVARVARVRQEVAELEAERDRCGKLALKAKDEEQSDLWMTKQAEAMRAARDKTRDAEALDHEVRAMEGSGKQATSDVWKSLIDGIRELDPDVRTTARKLVADTFESITVYNDGFAGDEPELVDIELKSKRGGVINLRVTRPSNRLTRAPGAVIEPVKWEADRIDPLSPGVLHRAKSF